MKESTSFDLQKDSKKKFFIQEDDNPFTKFCSGKGVNAVTSRQISL
jgi:hypothetical protein